MADAHLLHADEEQLDRASIALGDGTAFVIAVCPTEARNAALSRLRGRVAGLSLPDPIEVGTPDEILAALEEQAGRKDRVLSLTVERDGVGALDTLNLHREKLLAGGPVVLWVEDVEALRRLRERAPDAYSFRTTMVLVQGDGGPLPVSASEETQAVLVARKRLRRARMPADKASAGLELAQALHAAGRLEQAEQAARAGLLALPAIANDIDRELRVWLCATLASIQASAGKKTQEQYWHRRAMAELSLESFTHELAVRVQIMPRCPGPFHGYDRRAVDEALGLVNRYGLGPSDAKEAYSAATLLAIVQGDSRRARRMSSLIRVEDTADSMTVLELEGQRHLLEGSILEAESCFRQWATLAAEQSVDLDSMTENIANCLLLRGECEAAERLLEGSSKTSPDAYSKQLHHLRTSTALERAGLRAALPICIKALRAAEAKHQDQWILMHYEALVLATARLADSTLLRTDLLKRILTELDLAREILQTITSDGDGPAWFPIQLLVLMTHLDDYADETQEACIVHARDAFSQARTTYPDLVPHTARVLTDHMMHGSDLEEALTLIKEVEPLALETGFLEERALLLANRILALVLMNVPAPDLEPHIATFREALAATESKRTTAETLRDLASRLPPTATTPDPFALADEAHRLFVAMPMPTEESRCLEIMGDVLVARGHKDEARTRYLTARARLERYGLGLRIPLLNEKIAALG
ncbi:hypothetical protein [Polyangium jinanense]|uniref:Tetratricopeptide repeat protein n=1 Tax=Polyangium jinanense TaxID=2829994 RepID=A0A9X4ARG6_9BACT|nr:hypothetical protein [Polyangium jinanense]MDC3980060.1 hypothetical protein [Polyangium jinanense]